MNFRKNNYNIIINIKSRECYGKKFIKAVNETDLIGIFDCNYNNTLVTAKDVIDNIDYNVTIDNMLIFFEKIIAFYKEGESVAYFAGKAPIYTSNSKNSTALNIPNPKGTAKREEPKPQETPAKKVTPVGRVLHFLLSGIAAALLFFLLFSEKAGFIYLEENAIYSKIVLIVILTAIGTFLSEIRGFFYFLGVSVFIVLLIPYFVDYTIFIKILIALILGFTALYNLYRAFSCREKKTKAK